MDGWGYICICGVGLHHTGLEASRAPYSKSHARRLKRKEKEQLAGGLGILQAALPSIALTAATATTTSAGVTPAGKGDATAATIVTTATATRRVASAKKTVSKPESNVIPDAPGDAAVPQSTTTRPGQIGEGKGTPLTRSQRRRALYEPFFFLLSIRLLGSVTEATIFSFWKICSC
jgi:ribosome biogenesis protein SLX9